MREPRSNIGRVCDRHAPKPNPEWGRLPLRWFVGRLRKLGFAHHGGIEHMWVECTAIEMYAGALRLRGTVDNDPIYALDWPDGTELYFDRQEIEHVWSDELDRPVASPADHPGRPTGH